LLTATGGEILEIPARTYPCFEAGIAKGGVSRKTSNSRKWLILDYYFESNLRRSEFEISMQVLTLIATR
jgi:hypothetical protein